MKKPFLFGIILTVCVIIVTFVFAQFYPEGMISYWKFDADEGTTASDSADANDGTIHGAEWTTFGKVNGALSFDGVDDYVGIPSFTFNENNVYSVEFWFYPKATGLQYILDFRVANSAGQAATIAFDYHGNREIDYVIYGAGVPWPAPGTIALSLNEWHHVGIIHDSVNNRVISYVDGKKDIDETYSWDFTPIASPLKIGIRSGTYTVPTNGLIDEAAIYNRALSAEEIQQHYQDGLNGLGYGECVPYGMVSWWPGDGNANDIADGNNGSLQNGATFAAGKVEQAFSFDGVDEFVSIAHSTSLNPTNAITLDAWIFIENYTFYPAVVNKGNVGYQYDESYALFIDPWGRLGFLLNSDGTVEGRTIILGPFIPLNTWTYVAGTYDGVTMRMYADEQMVGSESHSGGMWPTPAYPVLIGKSERQGDPGGLVSSFFDGLIDEVEIFDRALPPSEIQAIYSAGKCKEGVVIEVTIDIKPSSDPNSINLSSASVIPVAILSSATFDATTVDPATVSLAGAEIKMAGKSGKYLSHAEDVNEDGLMDLVCQVLLTEAFDIEIGDTVAGLTAKTYDGQSIHGEDAIRIVPDK